MTLTLPTILDIAVGVPRVPQRISVQPVMVQLVGDVHQVMIRTTLERRPEDVVSLAHLRLVAETMLHALNEMIPPMATGSVILTWVARHLSHLKVAMAAEIVPLLHHLRLADATRLALPDPGLPLLT